MIRSDSGNEMKNSSENLSTSVKIQSPPWTTSTTICSGASCGALSTIYVYSSLKCSAYVYDNDTTTIQELRFNWKLNGSIDHTRYTYNVSNATLQYQSGSLWANPAGLPGLYFGKSDNIYCESRAYDGLYYSSYVPSAYYTVNNTAPTISAPTLDTYNPSNTSIVTCTGAVNYNDTDNDAMNGSYFKWYVNGANISANTSSINLGSLGIVDGSVIYCENWVFDSGYSMGSSLHYNSSPATVGTVTTPQITNCSSGFNVLNFSVLDEQTYAPIYATMEATFTLYNISSGAEFSNVSFYIQNRTSFAYCINPYAALTIVSSYQTYYPFSGSGYTQRNYYLFNSTLDASSPQQINIYLLNSSIGTAYTFQVVNQYLVPISGVKITVQRFMPTLNAWVVVEQKVTDFSGYALFDLQPGTLYKLIAEASGYTTINTDFTPGAVTSVQIRMQQSAGIITPLPNFEYVFNDVTYSLTPNATFFSYPDFNPLFEPEGGLFKVRYTVSSASSSLQNYSMVITRALNGTGVITVEFNTSVTTSPAGGFLQYDVAGYGTYTVWICFKHANYTNPYCPVPYRFTVGNSTGASAARALLATGFINGWAYYFIAVVCTMLAAGFALRYSPEAAGAIGLLVLWGFTFLNPAGVIVTGGGIGLTILYATVLTSIMVGAAMLLKWYI
jgi:hypothetical protein